MAGMTRSVGPAASAELLAGLCKRRTGMVRIGGGYLRGGAGHTTSGENGGQSGRAER